MGANMTQMVLKEHIDKVNKVGDRSNEFHFKSLLVKDDELIITQINTIVNLINKGVVHGRPLPNYSNANKEQSA